MKNGYFGVGLFRPKHAHNVGEVLRAAYNHNAAYVSIEGPRGTALQGAANTTNTHLNTPVFKTDDILSIRPHGAQIVVVDLIEGSQDIVDFVHPTNALYLFGPEDGSLGARHTASAQHVIHIPTRHCMNLAAAVNVVLYDRLIKSRMREAIAA